jgi:hypothetical protein
MPGCADQTRPVVRRRACLNADSTRWKICKEGRDLSTLQPSLHYDPAVGVNAVDLEHAFGEIKTDCGNLHAGGSFLVASSNDDHARHSMPFRRGRPPHQLQGQRIHPSGQGHHFRSSGAHWEQRVTAQTSDQPAPKHLAKRSIN